jgi:WD40 repeat protein
MNGRVWLGRTETGEPIRAFESPPDAVYCAAFHPTGRFLLTGSSDGTARLWDIATGNAVGEPLKHEGPVEAVAFSPDGKMMATGGTDRLLRRWWVETRQPAGYPQLLPGDVCSLAFSPDGRLLLTGCSDGTARLWDAATGWQIGPSLPHPSSVDHLEFRTDGKGVLTSSTDPKEQLVTSTLVQWELAPAAEDSTQRLRMRLEAATGLEISHEGTIRPLTDTEWERIRKQLAEGRDEQAPRGP